MVKTTVGGAENNKQHKSRKNRLEVDSKDDRKAKKTKTKPAEFKEFQRMNTGESEASSEENLDVVQPVNNLQTKDKPDVSEPRVETLSTKIFKPPPGFEPFGLNEDSNSPDFLGKSNIKGKQIWYFTAPTSLDVSSLKDLTLAALQTGTPVAEIDGDEFGFFPESADKHNFPKVLIPTASKNGYCFGPEPISQILQLQRIVNLPSTSGSQVQSTNFKVKHPAHRLPRAQPKGLRMRFHPIGCRSENPVKIGIESSSEESCPEPDDAIQDMKLNTKSYFTGPDSKGSTRDRVSNKPHTKETKVPPPVRKTISTTRPDKVSKISPTQELHGLQTASHEADDKPETKKSKTKRHHSKD